MSMSGLLSHKQSSVAVVDLRSPLSMESHRKSSRRSSANSLETPSDTAAGPRRHLLHWSQQQTRPETPSSDGCLTPPAGIMWSNSRRNSDVNLLARQGAPGLHTPLPLMSSSSSLLSGGLATINPSMTASNLAHLSVGVATAANASLALGRRRANSDLETITSLGNAVHSASAPSLPTIVSSSALTTNHRRDRDSKKSALYKTELCRSFEETGHCRYGSKCQFAHGHAELRQVLRHPKYKTEICRTFWEKGNCPYGKRCCFIHNEGPGGLAPSANGSAVSLINEPISEVPTTVSSATAVSIVTASAPVHHGLASGNSSTSSVTSSPMLAAMRASHTPDHVALPSTSTPGHTSLARASSLGTTDTTSSLLYKCDSPQSHTSTTASNTSSSEKAMPVTLTTTAQDWSSSTSGASLSMTHLDTLAGFPSPPNLLSTDLMKQLDLCSETKPRRSRAWTIDAMEDAPRLNSATGSAASSLGTIHAGQAPQSFYTNPLAHVSSNFEPSSPPTLGDNGAMMAAAAPTLLPVSPALSAASVHSTNGAPLTPPVPATTTHSLETTNGMYSYSTSNLLSTPAINGAANSRPRSASAGTVDSTSSMLMPNVGFGSSIGTTGALGAAATTAAMKMANNAKVAGNTVVAEQRRLPVFRRLGNQ